MIFFYVLNCIRKRSEFILFRSLRKFPRCVFDGLYGHDGVETIDQREIKLFSLKFVIKIKAKPKKTSKIGREVFFLLIVI